MNRALLLKIADFIESNPDRYNQSTWLDLSRAPGLADRVIDMDELRLAEVGIVREGACGTAACVAGNAILLADDADLRLVGFKGWRTRWFGDGGDDDEVHENVELVEWEESARRTLGLSERVAAWLFDSDRDEQAMPTVLRALAESDSAFDATTIGFLEDVEINYRPETILE